MYKGDIYDIRYLIEEKKDGYGMNYWLSKIDEHDMYILMT